MLGKKKLATARVIDPICGMKIDPVTAAPTRDHDGTTYYFCNKGCAKESESDPERYVQS